MRKITLITYGVKNQRTPNVDLDINCQVLKNPHNEPELKPLTGRDLPVKEFVFKDPQFGILQKSALWAVLDGQDTVAFHCFGGRHRSVAVAEIFADYLRDDGYVVELQHLSLDAHRMEATGVKQAASN